jgi:hypothetical protein
MTSETGTSRTADDIRGYLLRQLNSALRRPEMHGAETALRLYFDALAFTGRGEHAWAGDLSALRSREAFTPTGVTGAVERALGRKAADPMASVYAEIASQRAWLTLDNSLPEADHDRFRSRLPAWCTQDRSQSDVTAEFGEPSMLIGGSNPLCPKTLAYAAAHIGSPLIFFHLWNGRQPGTGADNWPLEHPQPILLAARCGGARFIDGFIFTPTGTAMRAALAS